MTIRRFALAAACALACAPEQPRTSGNAHAGTRPPALVQPLASTDPHAVQRDATEYPYCMGCHTEIVLANSHPVAVSQAVAAAEHPGMYFYPPPNPAFVLVYGEFVQCTSCHDDGSAGYPFKTVAADMCGGCHADKNDLASPTASITSPAEGATVQGTVSVEATVADDIAVTAVELYSDPAATIDSRVARVTPIGGAVSIPLDTTTLPNGPRVLLVRAIDSAGHLGDATVTVTISNPPPPDTTSPTVAVTAPSEGAPVRGTVAIVGTVQDDVGVVLAELWTGPSQDALALAGSVVPAGATATILVDTTAVADGPILGQVRAYDAAGNVGTATRTLVVDNTPPSVAISSPAEGAVVRGTVTIAAAASDASGVAKVDFLVDGALLATSTAAPYAASWTPARRSGPHALTAIATDAAGNAATSAAVTVVAK